MKFANGLVSSLKWSKTCTFAGAGAGLPVRGCGVYVNAGLPVRGCGVYVNAGLPVRGCGVYVNAGFT